MHGNPMNARILSPLACAIMITLLPAAGAQGTNANLDRAQALLAAHNYRDAAEAFTGIIAAAPDNSAAYHGRGMARINQNDYAGAIMDFDRALALDPGDAIGFNERGYAKMRMGDLKGALPDYDRCIALNPNYAPVHTNRGMMLRSSGNTQGAVLDFNRALAIAPNNERALTERASLRLSLGDAAGALADDSAIIAVDPKSSSVRYNRGLAHEKLGDRAGAVADYQGALALNPAMAAAKARVVALQASVAAAASSVRNPAPASPPVVHFPQSTSKQASPVSPNTGPASPSRNPAPVSVAAAISNPSKPQAALAVPQGAAAPSSTSSPAFSLAEPAESSRVLAPFTGYAEANPCTQPQAIPGAPWRSDASPTANSVGSPQLGQYQAMLRHTMEGLRLLYGSLTPVEDKNFNSFWAPFFDHPTQEALNYFQQITPLLDEMTVTLSNLDGMLPGMGEALQGTMLAEGDPASGAARVAAVQYQLVKAERARLDDLSKKVSALGNPPNPIAAKCDARQHHRKAIPVQKAQNNMGSVFANILNLQSEYEKKMSYQVDVRAREESALKQNDDKITALANAQASGQFSDAELAGQKAALDALILGTDNANVPKAVPGGPGSAMDVDSEGPLVIANGPPAGQAKPQSGDPENDPKVNAEAIAEHLALAEQSRLQADRWAADAAKEKNSDARTELQKRAANLYADAQAEKDLAESLRTGTMVHTRTDWDEQQHQATVSNIKSELAVFDAENKLLANIPKVADMVAGLDGVTLREQIQGEITDAIHSPDALRKLAAIYGKLQDKVIDQGQQQIEAAQDKVELWDHRLAVAENVEMAAGMGVTLGALWAPAEIGTLALGYAGATGFAEGGVKGATVAVVRSVSSRADVVISAYEGATKIDPATGQPGGVLGAVEGALWSIGTNKAMEAIGGRIQKAKADYALARQAAGGLGFASVARAGEGRIKEFDFQTPEQRYKTELESAKTPEDQAAVNEKYKIQPQREAMGAEKAAAKQRAVDSIRQGADPATAKEQYTRDLNAIDQNYATKETRNQEHQDVMKELGFDSTYDKNNKDIKPTGSKPTTAESDMDFSPVGNTPHEAYQKGVAYTEAMKKRGHNIDEYGDRWVDTTSDTTVWKPGFGADKPGSGSFEAETIFGTLPNSDKFGTKGGIEWTSSETHETDDPLGAVLANAGKAVGAGLGNSRTPDLHVIGKSAMKAVDILTEQKIPIEDDPVLMDQIKAVGDQIKALKEHKTPEQAGVVELGADPATQDRQVKSFMQKVQSLMGRAIALTKAKSDQNALELRQKAAAGTPDEAAATLSKVQAYQSSDQAAMDTIAQVSPGLASEMGRSARPADLMPSDPTISLNIGGLSRALAQDRDSDNQAPPLPADSSDPAFADLGRRCKLAAQNAGVKLAAAKPGSDEARYLADLKTALDQGGSNPAGAIRAVRGLSGMELPVVLAQLGAPAK